MVKNLLEVGCGQGIDLSHFCKNDAFVIGMDLTYNSIQLAKKRADVLGVSKNCDFVVANAERKNFKKNVFDMVYSYGVLHHTKGTSQSINNIQDIIKQGGEFKVMVYNKYGLIHLRDSLARLINKVAVKLTGKPDILWRILNKLHKPKKNVNSVTSYQRTGVSAILHAPYSTGYSKSELLGMLQGFSQVEFMIREPDPLLNSLTRRVSPLNKFISHILGFHLMAKAVK